jgi:dipeptidyl aminopeptidase/acylaminoacyl peptidase
VSTWVRAILILAALASPLAAQTPQAPTRTPTQIPLIPRAILFGNPDRARAALSPDGSTISYLAAAPNSSTLNVWIAPASRIDDARVITRDNKRGIIRYWWAHTSNHILYMQDDAGDENWHIHCTSTATGATIDLTPFSEIPGPDNKPLKGRDGKPLRPSARLVALSPDAPTTALVAVNNRDPRLHDLFRVDITSGANERIAIAPENTVDWVVDNSLTPRYAITFTDDGGQVWLSPGAQGKGTDGWNTAITLGPDDALSTGPVGFTADNQTMYIQDSRDRDTAALCSIDAGGGARTATKSVLAQDRTADLANVLSHPVTRKIQAASFTRLRTDWVILDDSIRSDFKTLSTLGRGDIEVVSRARDDKSWLILLRADDGPSSYYLYRRSPAEPPKAQFLFHDRAQLKDTPLARMRPLLITTRDGLEMVSYLTLPVDSTPPGNDNRPTKPLPTVLLVHGGPWARDEWGYNSFHQLLANRGYAVLSVNYRGSTGFGKSYLNAARREWAGKMHDDLIDATSWAIDQKIADKDKIAIMGGSYGGYATLVGLTFTPDTFACGVSIVGPSNLVTLLESIPEYWKPGMAMWRTRVGDVSTPEGCAFLTSRSPLTRVDKIQKPLLIGHGANDPRVKLEESNQIVDAMKARNIPVTYIVFPDEGHGFLRPENRIAFWGIAEAFLSKRLGGRAEPLGDSLAASSAEVRAGADQVPGIDGTPAKP